MNAVEFIFAAIAVFGATGIIFAWYSWIYGLDDAYQASIENKRKMRAAYKNRAKNKKAKAE